MLMLCHQITSSEFVSMVMLVLHVCAQLIQLQTGVVLEIMPVCNVYMQPRIVGSLGACCRKKLLEKCFMVQFKVHTVDRQIFSLHGLLQKASLYFRRCTQHDTQHSQSTISSSKVNCLWAGRWLSHCGNHH